MAHRGREDPERVERLNAFLDRFPDAIRRVSIQRQKPHLMMRVDLPALRDGSAEEFFEALQELLK